MFRHSKKKYRYAWMSFSQYEQKELEAYLNEMAGKGYRVSKIARFYLRFKYSDDQVPPYYVQGNRKYFFSHWYWTYSHEPLPSKKTDDSRFWYLLFTVLFLASLTLFSILSFEKWPIIVFYSDIALVMKLLFPLYCISYLLDSLGRLYECFRKKHCYRFCRFRAFGLGLNMIFRYLLFFFLLLPTVLKELQPPVVFIILLVGIYEVAYFYLPHRHRWKLLVLSAILSFCACFLMVMVNEWRPYKKNKVDYDTFASMRLENFVHEKDLDNQLNYARQVHRYTSTSLLVPLYYQRIEKMHPVHDDVHVYEAASSFIYCHNIEIAEYLFWHMADYHGLTNAEMLNHSNWQVDEIILLDEKHIILRKDEMIIEFSGTFDFTDKNNGNLLYDLIQQSLKKPLLH